MWGDIRWTAIATGVVALAACETAPPKVTDPTPPGVVDGRMGYVEGKPRDYYDCGSYAERAGLGGFSLRRGFTLDGAPYISVNDPSWLMAEWNTRDWRAPSSNPRSKDYHYNVSWNGEAAETVSLETKVYISIVFVTSREGLVRVQLSRRDGKPPERTVAHDFSGVIYESSTTRYTNTNVIAVNAWLSFSIADLLMFAGTEPVLIATAFDGKGDAVKTVEVDIQELRDGVAMMRDLMRAFEAETQDYATACKRDLDYKIYLTSG